jgi:hypothetical protein
MLWRLGVLPRGAQEDAVLIQAMEQALTDSAYPVDRFFFDWRGGDLRIEATDYAAPAFDAFRHAIAAYVPNEPLDHAYWADTEPCGMLIDEVEAIWAPIAEHDDWARFEAKVASIRAMGDALRVAN